jgi:uncharacterized repeat protein (TIGR03803 family)
LLLFFRKEQDSSFSEEKEAKRLLLALRGACPHPRDARLFVDQTPFLADAEATPGRGGNHMIASRTHAYFACCLALLAPAAGAQTLTTLYQFTGQTDGSTPQAALVYQNGSLFGITVLGGTTGNGTVFKIDPATGAYSLLYNFQGGTDGAAPSILIGKAGTLYGATFLGGNAACDGGCGTVFSVNPATGAETVLYAFAASQTDASFPLGLLYQKGILYGTSIYGGGSGCGGPGCGTVFTVDPSTGAETILHNFAGGADGENPGASPTYYNGALYGTTYAGGGTGCGGPGCGAVFKIDPKTGTESIAFSFTAGLSGSTPYSNLVEANGIFYSTTLDGVDSSPGGVIAFNPATGAEQILHSFTGLADGALPAGAVVQRNGYLYGATYEAGAYPADCKRNSQIAGCGTIYKVDTHSGHETVEHRFTGTDGAHALAGLIYAGGAFYGVATAGGSNACPGGCGTVFKFVP